MNCRWGGGRLGWGRPNSFEGEVVDGLAKFLGGIGLGGPLGIGILGPLPLLGYLFPVGGGGCEAAKPPPGGPGRPRRPVFGPRWLVNAGRGAGKGNCPFRESKPGGERRFCAGDGCLSN